MMSSKVQHIQNLRHIFEQAVESVRPANLLNSSNNYCLRPQLKEKRFTINIQGNTLDITHKRIYVVGFGKAVLGMAVQLEQMLQENILRGILSVPVGTLHRFASISNMQLKKNSSIEVIEGAVNNHPDDSAHRAAQKIKDLAVDMTGSDILFVLISGGGSALLPLPRSPIKLEAKMNLIKELSNKGASIDELNIVRIALSDIKGGRLAQFAQNAFAVISFVISDIVGNPVDLIASGPTCATLTQHNTAENIMRKYGLLDSLKQEVRNIIVSPRVECTPSINNFIYIVGDNRIAVASIMRKAIENNYVPFTASTTIQGEVRDVVTSYTNFLQDIILFGNSHIDELQLKERFPFDELIFPNFVKALYIWMNTKTPLLLIFGGEPTLKVTGHGCGGRNQELALRISLELYKNSHFKDIIFMSAGTDGIDGPTPVAGAVGGEFVISNYLKDESHKIQTVIECLRNNDSYNFYKNVNGGEYHVVTGHTGTNVMDIHLFLVETPKNSSM